ncbi:hypothetical protein U1Q18_039666, partial [Sarracenia purpurea var. burkii]
YADSSSSVHPDSGQLILLGAGHPYSRLIIHYCSALAQRSCYCLVSLQLDFVT